MPFPSPTEEVLLVSEDKEPQEAQATAPPEEALKPKSTVGLEWPTQISTIFSDKPHHCHQGLDLPP